MSDYHPYRGTSKRQVIDYLKLVALSEEKQLICLHPWVIAVCRKFLATRARWASTYSVSYTNSGYFSPDDAQMDILTEVLAEGAEDMASCSEISDSLVDIASAIAGLSTASGGCGCGAGGAGSTEAPQDPTDTGDIYDTGQTPPEGFATWADYQDYKCTVSHWIVNGLLTDIQWLQTVDFAALTVASAAAGLAFLIPGVNIAALVILLTVTMVGLGLGQSALQELEDSIIAIFDDLVCDLFTGSDVDAARLAFETALDTEIDVQTGDLITRAMMKELYRYWLSNDAFNKLVVKDAALNAPLKDEATDCPCTAVCAVTTVHGTYNGGLNWDSVFISAGPNSHYRVELSADCCLDIELQSISGWTAWQAGDAYIACGAVPVYQGDVPPGVGVAYCNDEWALRSNTAFNVTLNYTNGGVPC